MAEILLSPGVLARENDKSQITEGPIQAGSAIIGPTVKGRVGIPTLVTSYSEYKAHFGAVIESGSSEHTYFTSISAQNYFQQGGTSLLVTRVASGSLTSATASVASGSSTSSADVSFVLETLSEGANQNSSGSVSSDGSLENGTVNNLRWEVVGTNLNLGTFNLLLRQGDDYNKQKVILETHTNLSLDPNSPNYIARRIGDQVESVENDGTDYIEVTGTYPNRSRYIRVKSVEKKTLNYFNNDGTVKTEFTASLPQAKSGTFGGATGTGHSSSITFYENITSTNTQGLTDDNYTASISLLSNADEYQYNVITVPGLNYEENSTVLDTLIDNTQNRGDAIAVIDMEEWGATITDVVGNADLLDSSYTATYWPWLMVVDPDLDDLVWVPASTMIPGVYAFNDSNSETWFAPAGLNRGSMNSVVRAERKLTNANRDDLYQGRVNPIATFPNTGVVVFGQKTLQKKASALDRVNVRRLLITLKDFISGVADNLVFEQNTIATRNNFLSQVNPYLASVQQRQGLYAFKVVMDESNNTPDVIDRNQLIGQIYIQPTKTAEFIYLDFNILPTGATFPA